MGRSVGALVSVIIGSTVLGGSVDGGKFVEIGSFSWLGVSSSSGSLDGAPGVVESGGVPSSGDIGFDATEVPPAKVSVGVNGAKGVTTMKRRTRSSSWLAGTSSSA